MTEKYITRKEAADILAVCPHSIMKWEKQGIIKPLRITNKTIRYRLSDIEKLLESDCLKGCEPMKNKPGRPTKPEKERAGYRAVNVRLNAKQWEHLNLARLMNGLPRESFIKDLIEKAPIPESIARALKETK